MSEISQELMAIQRANPAGLLQADEALAWAKAHPQSALYRALEWDDKVAANEHRINQIRSLIRIHIVSSSGEPMAVSLSIDRSQGGGYRMIDDVVKDRTMSDVMLRDALAELERAQKKFSRVEDLTSVWAEVARVRKRVTRKAAGRAERRPRA